MNKLTDQQKKWRLVFWATGFAVIGFVLEVGPLGGIYSLLNSGPPVFTSLLAELAALGFLAYLSLPAAALIGLHINEDEVTPKEGSAEEGKFSASQDGDGVIQKVRVRPELHQLRMLATAIIGYSLFKITSLLLLYRGVESYGLSPISLVQLFNFGFGFVALGWFALWQFLRWYAQKQQWTRIQDELIGADMSRILAVLISLRPLVYLISVITHGSLLYSVASYLTLGMVLTVLAASVILWFARPYTLKRTIVGLASCGVLLVLLTVWLGIVEHLKVTN